MLEVFKEAVNAFCSPVSIFTVSLFLFFLFVGFPRFFTHPVVALVYLAAAIGFFAIGLTDENFRGIVTKADNVPIVAMIFIFGYFTWYSMRKAVMNDQRIAEGKPTIEKEESDEKVLVFPYLIYIEFVAALLYAAVLVFWSIYLKAPLEEPANPTLSPNPSKAPWYFLGLQEMLVYFDPWLAGVLFPTFIILGLCAIPYLDRDPKTSGYFSFAGRKSGIIAFLFGFWILWNVLIVMGTFLRGPNWNFFGPFEAWNVHKIVPLVNVNLSEFIFIKWMGVRLPTQWWIREAPGIFLTFFYLIVPPYLLAKLWLNKLYAKMGPPRYALLMILTMSMISLPIKMYLRWAFNLKYIVAIPEFFFNI